MSPTRLISHDEFEALRSQFQPLGKIPPQQLVSDVARAIAAAEAQRW